MFGLPESPRYLYKHGRNDEALEVLCAVYDGDASHPKVAKEQEDVLRALEIEQKQGEYRWSQLLKRDEVLKRVRANMQTWHEISVEGKDPVRK